jgi:hypothetical protein
VVKEIKKLLTSVMGMAIVLAMMTGGVLAYTSDVERSWGKNITSGTIDLVVQERFAEGGNGSSGIRVAADMVPGSDLGARQFSFKSEGGASEGSRFQITAEFDIIDPPGPESDIDGTQTWEMAQQMVITNMDYYSGDGGVPLIDCLALLSDWDGDGKKTLNDLKLDAEQPDPDLDELPPPGAGEQNSTHLDIALKYDEGADNRFQGDTLLHEIIFILWQ